MKFEKLRRETYQNVWNEIVKEVARLNTKIEKLLDIGCGKCLLLKIISKRFKVKEIWGVDISEKSKHECIKRGIKFVKHNVEYPLPFEDNLFDVVICNQVMEHIYNTDDLISETYRILRPNGFLYFRRQILLHFITGFFFSLVCNRQQYLLSRKFLEIH
ncbi:MAG: class I SAM-dependent methyltransferase [Candidatus Aenigmarchaeota archaeon]|nr:class I SAM-dependent methyltransferase [Candidatus Aenigmarchaeota archaeon]